MARRRFSIHLSLSADERQEKHLLPVEVLTWKKGSINCQLTAEISWLPACLQQKQTCAML